jgi:hypothetical protein
MIILFSAKLKKLYTSELSFSSELFWTAFSTSGWEVVPCRVVAHSF